MAITDLGPPDAKIMIVGEAPGEQEERLGQPFVGQAGQLLKQMLAHSGIDFNQCYVTNVMAIRPPANDFAFFYDDAKRQQPTKVLEQGWYDLRQKVERLKPNVVICLGAEPLRALTGLRGVMTNRGIVHKFNGIKIIATYHPSAVIRQYELHPIVELDFSKSLRESQYPEHRFNQPELLLSPSLNQTLEWLGEASNAKQIAFDIETIEKHIRCISFAFRSVAGFVKAISIPFMKFSTSAMAQLGGTTVSMLSTTGGPCSFWSADQEILVLEAVAKLFANPTVKFISQNGIQFDQPLIERNWSIEIVNHYLDTMHAWHVLFAELPKGLDFLASVLTDYPAYWNKLNRNDDRSEWEYNAMDSACTLECAEKIEAELFKSGQNKVYFDIVHPLALALARMSDYGVLVDLQVREELCKEVSASADKYQKEIFEHIKKEINLNSPVQLKKLIFEELRYPVVKNKDNKPSVDEECLRRLERSYPHEKLFSLIIAYRKEQKVLSTFLQTPVGLDGRMHSSYDASGTESSRISSSSNLWGEGMNLQNIPAGRGRGIRNLKHVFIARKDVA